VFQFKALFGQLAYHHQTAAPKLIDPATLVNREVSELLSEVLSGISKSRAAFSKCCTACQGGRLLPGDAARELQILNSFRRCRAASENRELLSGNAARQT